MNAPKDLLELTKPRLSSLVLVTTAAGFWLGLRGGAGQLARLAPVLIGTALVVGGANALNEWMERELDARMQRTRMRPLPSGRVTPAAACGVGVGLTVAGLAFLTLAVNPLTAALAFASWASYVLLYTPLKRITPHCTLVGAVPGALPPVIGWAGASGAVGSGAWALFGILYLWQLPHFLALAILYRDDYAQAGFRMLPLIESGTAATARQIMLYGLVLLPVSLVPSVLGLTGTWYFYGAFLLSALLLAAAARAALLRTLPSARQLFRASVAYLPLLLALLAWDRTPL